MKTYEGEKLMKKYLGIILVGLLSIGALDSAQAEYPAISGLPLIAGYNGKLFAIDTTPKSLPINSKFITVVKNQDQASMSIEKSTVFRILSLRRNSILSVDIRPFGVDNNKATFLGLIKSDRKGNIQLPAIAVLQPGKYSLTIFANGVSRKVSITAA